MRLTSESIVAKLPTLTQVADVHATFDLVVEQLETAHACMRCMDGCSQCCHQLPQVPLCDWQVVLDYMHTHWTREQRCALVARTQRQARKGGVWAQLASIRTGGQTLEDLWQRLTDVQTHAQPACPLLRDGRCTVYPARPSTCRAYGRTQFSNGEPFWCGIIERQVDDALAAGSAAPSAPRLEPFMLRARQLSTPDQAAVAPIPLLILKHALPDGDLAPQALPFDDDDYLHFPIDLEAIQRVNFQGTRTASR